MDRVNTMMAIALDQTWVLVWWAFALYALASAFYIILENRQTETTFAWLLLFIVLPGIGVIIYFFFGRDQRPFSARDKLTQQVIGTRLSQELDSLVEEQEAVIQQFIGDPAIPSTQRRLLELLYRTRLSLLTLDNHVEILQDAAVKYPALMEDIERAKHSIHMEYFIWQADDYMDQFADLLIKKAQQGVKVRILYDALGSLPLNFWRRGYVRRLRRGGVEIYAYLNFFSPHYLHSLNYRNHRKIAVIDGEIGYTGGMNMGKEHLVGAGPYHAWRDTHLRLTGSAVAVLQAVFVTSWYNTTTEELTDPAYFHAADQRPADTPIHIVVSGPDSQWYAIQQLYFYMILSAQHHVYIQTPVFIPDPSIAQALRTAALSGVDVKLMCAPRDTLSPVINWAANTYFADMARAGVKVYLYQPAYLHAKTISIDSTLCSVGAANLDIRSFSVNYELNAVLYDEAHTQRLERDFLCDLEHCTQFSAEEYRRRNILLRFRDSLARLLSPLL
jgi:cardiolipin synthase